MKEIKRYQDCNLIIKLYRRLKYQPYYFLKALYCSIEHLMTKKNNRDTEIYKASFIFSLIYCEWQMKANWMYSFDSLDDFRDFIFKDFNKKD